MNYFSAGKYYKVIKENSEYIPVGHTFQFKPVHTYYKDKRSFLTVQIIQGEIKEYWIPWTAAEDSWLEEIKS